MADTSTPYTVELGAHKDVSGTTERTRHLDSVPAYPSNPGPASASPRGKASAPVPQSPPAAQVASSEPKAKASPSQTVGPSPPGHQKRKSIGSKILSKIKPSHTDKTGEKSDVLEAQQPTRPSSPDEYDEFVEASKLKDALHEEQKRRHKIKQDHTRDEGGARRRQTYQDVDDNDDQPVRTSRYRGDSNSSRHFPGDIFESQKSRRPRESFYNDPSPRPRSASGASQDKELSDLDEDGQDLDDIMLELRRPSYDSDDSDDTLTHLIREAEGYDALRYGENGKLNSAIDFDTLHEVHNSEVSASGDGRSSHSSYSGGASKALSKPLLELEDIELERFLKTFARHTRQVTVTHSTDKQNRRMPKWSDFRVSMPESPNGTAVTQRPSMLARVDRSLKHLTDNLQSLPFDDTSGKNAQSKDTSTALPSDAEDRSAALSDADDGYTSPHSPRKTKKKASKKSKQAKSKSKDKKPADDENEQDWDLITSAQSPSIAKNEGCSGDDLHVSAQDEGVDGVAFCIAYILAFVELLAPEEIDHHPDRSYREGLIRSHLERLYTIAPFWEQLGFRIRRLYRWEDPKTTAAAAMIYFVLWYTDMIPTAFLLTIMFYIMRFKYFPPSESYLHEKVKQRMARGQAANTLSDKLRRRSRLDILTIYKRWAAAYGAPTQEAMGMIADFHEKVKNLILWRNPAATRRTLILFGALNLFVTFTPSHYVYKTGFFGLGITFFCLLPLQSYFPSHRKALSPLWWATFGAPTDAQFAVQILRKRHLDVDKFAGKSRTAEDVRRAVQSQKGSRAKPRGDRREDGIRWDQLEDPSRANQDYVENSKDASYKPRKLGSYFCQYKGLPGRLHINTKYLYFTPLHSPAQKRGHTALEAIDSLVKTKNIRLGFWNSLGLKITRNNGKAPMLLANVQHRDDAFNLILAVSTGAG